MPGATGLVRSLANRLTPSARITVMTGAGVSAASGVPTFRGADGLWKQFKPETLATADAFARDPKLVWEWYDWRRQTIAACQPNAAHHVLANPTCSSYNSDISNPGIFVLSPTR